MKKGNITKKNTANNIAVQEFQQVRSIELGDDTTARLCE